MPALTTGEIVAVVSVIIAAAALFISTLTLAWKQGRSEGKFNEAITNLAKAIETAAQEAKKDADKLWEHQRSQDARCAAQIAKEAELEGKMRANLALIPGIAESVENLRRETKQDIGDLRKEIGTIRDRATSRKGSS